MIIDIHTHLYDKEVPSAEYWEMQAEMIAPASNRPIEKVREWLSLQWDMTGDLLVKDMDEAGIDKSVLLPLDFNTARWMGEGKYSITEINELYAKAAQNHPDRLIAFAGVDPRRPEAIELLERGVKEWNMKGLKLMPATGWYPDDKAYYPLYEKVLELDIPILCHTGPEVFPMRAKYARPAYVDEVASDFPDLKIVIAHAGHCWWEEAAWIVGYNTNMYLDLAQWQLRAIRDPVNDFYRILRSIISTAGISKVLLGSDWPAFRATKRANNAAWVKFIKDPPPEVKEAGLELSEEEKAAILGGNAARLLRLE